MEKTVDNSDNILNYINVIAKHKKMIIWSVVIVSIAAVIFSLVTPVYWISYATFRPIDDNSGLSLNAGSLFGLGSSMFGSSQTTGLDYKSIMRSRTFSEKVIDHFDLYSYFKLKDEDPLVNRDNAIKNLRENMVRIEMDKITSIISIIVETKDKDMSADIANFYWQELDKYNLVDRNSKAKMTREFLEERVDQIKKSIEQKTDSLQILYERYNIIDIDSQAKMLIENYSNLISRLEEEKMKLEYQKLMFPSNEQLLSDQQQFVNLIKQQIDEYEKSTDSNAMFLPKFLDVPKASIAYAKLEMELDIDKKVLEFVYPQLEAAKIEELKKTPSLEVIDTAQPAGLRSKPKRAMFCISVFVIALSFFTILAFLVEATNKALKEENNQRVLNEIKFNLFGKK